MKWNFNSRAINVDLWILKFQFPISNFSIFFRWTRHSSVNFKLFCVKYDQHIASRNKYPKEVYCSTQDWRVLCHANFERTQSSSCLPQSSSSFKVHFICQQATKEFENSREWLEMSFGVMVKQREIPEGTNLNSQQRVALSSLRVSTSLTFEHTQTELQKTNQQTNK